MQHNILMCASLGWCCTSLSASCLIQSRRPLDSAPLDFNLGDLPALLIMFSVRSWMGLLGFSSALKALSIPFKWVSRASRLAPGRNPALWIACQSTLPAASWLMPSSTQWSQSTRIVPVDTPGREKRGATSVPHSKHYEKNWSEVSTGGDSFLPKLSFSISHQQQSLVDDHDGRDNWLWRKSQSPLIPKRTPFFLSAVPEAGLGHSVPSCLQRAHTPLTLAFLFLGPQEAFATPKDCSKTLFGFTVFVAKRQSVFLTVF